MQIQSTRLSKSKWPFIFSLILAINAFAQKDADFILKKTWADLYSQKGNYTQAIQNYAIAMSIDPSCNDCKRAIKELKKKIEENRKLKKEKNNIRQSNTSEIKKNNQQTANNLPIEIKNPMLPEMVLLKYPYINEDSTLNDFLIGKYEISQKEWKVYCEIKNLDFPKIPTNLQNENFPIINISWQEAKNYTQWLYEVSGNKYDLPTKEEWLIAKTKIENLKNEAWVFENSQKTIHIIGKKAPNKFNIYDMEGNVSEWVEDWSDKDFLNEKELKDFFNENDNFKNRIVCGCSYKDETYFCKSTFLRSYDSEIKKDFIGFRIVQRKF